MFSVVKSGFITIRATGENIGITYNIWDDGSIVSRFWIRIIDFDDSLEHRESLEHILHTQISSASNKKEKYIERLLRTGLCQIQIK